MITGARRLTVLALTLALTLPVAACSGSSHKRVTDSTGATLQPTSSSSLTATRWWSNSEAAQGSTIDPKQPGAAAAKLHASEPEYCAMLKQTLAAGKSILPDASATDPALLASTQAFVAELQAVAPPAVAGQWQVLGDALVSFVKTGGKSLGSGSSSAAVTKAAQAISTDATKSCHLDLTSAAAPSK